MIVSKRLMLTLHRWCGLVAALLLLLQAMTGCILVYREPLTRLIDPAGMTRQSPPGQARSPAAVAAAVAAALPGTTIKRIVLPAGPRDTYFIHLAGSDGTPRFASVDPGTLRLLRTGTIWSFPAQAAQMIHYDLMAGTAGLVLILLLGTWLFGLIVTGLIFWWPKRGRILSSLKVNGRLSARLKLRQIHRTAGVAAALPLLVSATTGWLLAFGPLADSFDTLPPAPPAAAYALPAIDRAVDAARQRFPGSPVRDIRWASPSTLAIFLAAPERNPTAVHGVRVDLASGRILSVTPAAQDTRLWVPVLPIHHGLSFGPLGPALILYGGLTLIFLSISGPIMWLNGRRARKARR